jgi:Domain of unknown function (DUF6894)
MARYYFHITSADEYVRDDEGLELHTLSACHAQALRIIRECYPFVQGDRCRWWIEIADTAGRTALVVLYPQRFGWQAEDPTRDGTYWSKAMIRIAGTR